MKHKDRRGDSCRATAATLPSVKQHQDHLCGNARQGYSKLGTIYLPPARFRINTAQPNGFAGHRAQNRTHKNGAVFNSVLKWQKSATSHRRGKPLEGRFRVNCRVPVYSACMHVYFACMHACMYACIHVCMYSAVFKTQHFKDTGVTFPASAAYGPPSGPQGGPWVYSILETRRV